MRPRRQKPDPEKQKEILARFRREQDDRQSGYREQALALFPHVCARCGREFSGATLRELTVHHKDTDHTNNPPDGRNWELLCLYCHDDEHSDHIGRATVETAKEPPLGHNPFAGLKDMLKPEDDETDPK